MKNVLIVDSDLRNLQFNASELTSMGYRTLKASSISKANEIIKSIENNIDFLIVELNLSNEFISDELKAKTAGGVLTGWVWLYNVARPALAKKPKVIIYSDFISELEDVMEHTANPEEYQFFKNCNLVSVSDAIYNQDLKALYHL